MPTPSTTIEDSATTPPWLRKLGFLYNPFAEVYLESSNDPHLSDYLIGHDRFSIAWDESPALIFAPAGGGKTATRIYAARSCWVGLGGIHAFPLPYLLDSARALTPEGHVRAITRAGAVALMIALAYRPALFEQLTSVERSTVAHFLNHHLPRPLVFYLAMLRSGEPPHAIAAWLERSYVLPTPREPVDHTSFCAAAESALTSAPLLHKRTSSLKQLAHIVLDLFQFRALVLQIDSADASAATNGGPQAMLHPLQWLLEQVDAWVKQRIIVKAFLPSELAPLIPTPAARSLRTTLLEWTPPMLAEVVRRRVYQASDEQFGSLDAISSPALRDVETQLARAVLPLPREIIVLTNRLLEAYDQRTGNTKGQLEREDVASALRWYEQHQVNPGLIVA